MHGNILGETFSNDWIYSPLFPKIMTYLHLQHIQVFISQMLFTGQAGSIGRWAVLSCLMGRKPNLVCDHTQLFLSWPQIKK